MSLREDDVEEDFADTLYATVQRAWPRRDRKVNRQLLQNVTAGDHGMVLGRLIQNDCHGFLSIELFQIDREVGF